MSAPLLQAHGLTVSIAGKCVCRELDLALMPGEVLGILGVNGVGKSTLLHTLAGLRPADAGEIFLQGAPLARLSRRRIARQLGLLPQQPEDGLPATVLETALIGRHPHIDFWRWESHADVAAARRALRAMGLEGLEQRPQYALSGGERRRLALATILSQDPRVLLLDEPVQQLDLRYQITVLNLTAHLAREGRTVAMSLHDVNLAARYCRRLLMLFGNGELRLGPSEALLAPDILSRLFGTPVREIATGDGRLFLPA